MEWSDGGYDDQSANVFVDWNQTEDWSSADETVEDVDDESTTATTTVAVPSDAPTGSTLVPVRVAGAGSTPPATPTSTGRSRLHRAGRVGTVGHRAGSPPVPGHVAGFLRRAADHRV